MYTYQNRGQLSYGEAGIFFLNGEAVFNMYTLLDINISIFAFLCSSRSPRAMIAAENCVIAMSLCLHKNLEEEL